MTPATLLKLKQTSPAVAVMWHAYLDGAFPSLEAALIHLAECQSRIITDLVMRTATNKSPLDERLEADKQRAMFLDQLAQHAQDERLRRSQMQLEAVKADFYDQFRPSRREHEIYKAEMFNTPEMAPPRVIPARDWGHLKHQQPPITPQIKNNDQQLATDLDALLDGQTLQQATGQAG